MHKRVNVLLVENIYSDILFAILCDAENSVFDTIRRYVSTVAGIVPALGSQIPYQKWKDMPDILAAAAENGAGCAQYGISLIKGLDELKGYSVCDIKTVDANSFVFDVCGVEPREGWVLVQYDGSIRSFHVTVRAGLKDPLVYIGEYARKNGVGVWGDLMKLPNSADYWLIETTSSIRDVRGEIFGYVSSKANTPQLP